MLSSNLWAPNQQRDLVNVLGKHYKFSPRLLALIQSDPPANPSEEERPQKYSRVSRLKHAKNDVETASRSLHSSQSSQETVATNSLPRLLGQDHYGIASRLYNYQSIDVGPRCRSRLCLEREKLANGSKSFVLAPIGCMNCIRRLQVPKRRSCSPKVGKEEYGRGSFYVTTVSSLVPKAQDDPARADSDAYRYRHLPARRHAVN